MAFLVWAILFFTAPLKINIELSWNAYFLMALAMFSFLCACYIPSRSFKSFEINADRLKSIFIIILTLALIGVLLKLFDRFVIRGISLGAGNMFNREQMETGSGNPLGIIASTIAPFGYIPIFLMWKYKLKLWWHIKVIVYFVFFAQIFDAFLVGSRSVIFVNLMFLLLHLIYLKRIILKTKTYLILGLTGLVVFGIMNYIFIERSKEFLGDKVYDLALNESNFNYTANRTNEFQRNFDKKNDIEKSISFSYMITVQYFTHGMIEYSYLVSNYNSNHTYGAYTFNVYYRFIDKIFGTNLSIENLKSILPRYGVYTTLLGSIFVDFGWFIIVFMFLFGRLVKIVYETALKGTDWAILMYFYIFIILVFWPVFNFINGAGGLFTITSLICFSILSRYLVKE